MKDTYIQSVSQTVSRLIGLQKVVERKGAEERNVLLKSIIGNNGLEQDIL